jgi:hypothetical protein
MIRTIHVRTTLMLATASAVVLVAGCGGTAPSSTSAGTGPPKGLGADAYKFSRCMRQHGVSSFPDPKVINEPGHQGVEIHITPSISGSPAFKTAQNACQGIMPGPGGNDGDSPQQVAARVKGLISFANCMRSHHVSTFPDPTTRGQITPTMLRAAGINLHAPAVDAAALACVPASGGQLTSAQVEQGIHGGGSSSSSSSP